MKNQKSQFGLANAIVLIVRVWQAIADPPQLGVKVVVEKIMAELAEVKEERDHLLNSRVHKLEHDLASLTTMVKGEQKKTSEIDRKLNNVEHSEYCRVHHFGVVLTAFQMSLRCNNMKARIY
jgi:hypothetical protein